MKKSCTILYAPIQSFSIVDELVQKTMDELAAPPKPLQSSRTWHDPEGYRYLVQWPACRRGRSNAVLLRYLVRLFTNHLPKVEFKRKVQVDDAARSVVRNIEEGYKRANTSTYVEFIGFSQGSLEEVKGDIRELTEDGFLKSRNGSSLSGLGIDLGAFNQTLRKTKGGYRNVEEKPTGKDVQYQPKDFSGPIQSSKHPLPSFTYTPITTLYPPLAKVRSEDLTYEVFFELINKTDYTARH